MDSKIQNLQQIDDNMKELDTQIRSFHDSLDIIAGRYEQLEQKNELIDRTMTDMDKAYTHLQDLETKLEDCRREVDLIPVKIETVQRGVNSLVENNGRINEAMDKLNSLDSILNTTQERIDQMLNVQTGIARTEERLQEVAKVADDNINLLHEILKQETPDSKSGSSDLTSLSKKENVKNLTRRGWDAPRIATALKMSVSEVNLILDFFKSEK